MVRPNFSDLGAAPGMAGVKRASTVFARSGGDFEEYRDHSLSRFGPETHVAAPGAVSTVDTVVS
jgi:hypothetical protein